MYLILFFWGAAPDTDAFIPPPQARRKFLEQWRAKWDHPDASHHHGDDDDPEEQEEEGTAGVGNIEAGSQAFAASAAETPRGLGARLKKIATTVRLP